MSQQSSFHRLLDIMRRLNESQTLCLELLADEYEVSSRTIRRDFELIKEVFGSFMTKEGNCYKAHQKALLEKVLTGTQLTTLANILSTVESASLKFELNDDLKKLIKKSHKVYAFRSKPFEELKNQEVIKKLEHAIEFYQEVEVSYTTKKGMKKFTCSPYKILFLNENFYLACEHKKKNPFLLSRISMIQEINSIQKTFKPNHHLRHFIENIQTPWASYKPNESSFEEVLLEVNASISKYFKLKKYLNSQNILKEYENGNLLISYKITGPLEIEELIIKWLPEIKIISPEYIQRFIKKELERKLSVFR